MAAFDDDWVTRHVTLRDVMLHRTGVSRSFDELWLMEAHDRRDIVWYVGLFLSVICGPSDLQFDL